jgi:3-oxoacyl-[acyl-carrier protein] reductase
MQATTLIESFRVDGRVAVVTGAGSGIGRASALALAGAGAAVVCAPTSTPTRRGGHRRADRRPPAAPPKAWSVDVSDSGPSVDALAGAGRRRAGRHPHLVQHRRHHGRGTVPRRAARRTSTGSSSVNLKGVFFGCQAAGRVMVDPGREAGSIINASSAAADAPSPNIASYAICKAGVVQMTKSMAVEVGKKHVRVNAVAPGFVLTGMTGRYFVRPDGTVDEEMQEAVVAPMRKFTPLRSIGEPEDIAAAVLYLASDASRFMTGQVLRPNGGVAMV